jgi:hypothetical protein
VFTANKQILPLRYGFPNVRAIYIEKTKFMSMSRDQNSDKNHNLKISDRCFENVAKFKYL